MAAPVNTGCPTTIIDDMARQPDGYWQQGIYNLPDFPQSFWWNKKDSDNKLGADFDIEGMDVFCVERDEGKTVISFNVHRPEGLMPESWYLDISAQNHEYLLRRFLAKMELADIKRRAEFHYMEPKDS